MSHDFPIKILVAPGKTRDANEEDQDYLRKLQPLLEAACEAEELIGIDVLDGFDNHPGPRREHGDV